MDGATAHDGIPGMSRPQAAMKNDAIEAAVVLAADVGGTHARVGLLNARPKRVPPVDLLACQTYECAKWPGLAEILEDFLARHANHHRGIARCALAVAGYLRGDELVAENLRWPVRISELRTRLNLDRLDIINDFEALACGTGFLSARDSIAVIEAGGAPGPTVVVGPGTGLGCA
ncbi:MAG: glucokinase, partial [Rhodanobacteraceae bacterium]